MSLALAKENTFGATLLVTGCCIGAGMIGLPVSSLAAGFLPSSVAMIFSYLFTTGTGLLLLEATLWFDQKVNLLTIAEHITGRIGKLFTGALFLFLFYSIFVAYMDGGGQLFGAFLEGVFQISLPRPLCIFSCIAFVFAITYFGMRSIDPINKILMIGLGASYVFLVFTGLFKINPSHLAHTNWSASLSTLPILFICFGFQNLVPSISAYLKYNVQAIRTAIILGNLIPLFFYLVWNFVILGILEPNHSSGEMVAHLLQETPSLYRVSQAFSFFALATSFIAITISFVDFFKDGLKDLKMNKILYECLIFTLVFLPPFLISLSNPHIFLKALEFAGGIVDIILFGILPTLFVWKGRFIQEIRAPYRVFGGKPFLLFMGTLSLALLLLRAIQLHQ